MFSLARSANNRESYLFRKGISQSENTTIFVKAADVTEWHYNAQNFRLTEMQIFMNETARSLALWTQTSLHAVLTTVFSGVSASLNLLRVVRKF